MLLIHILKIVFCVFVMWYLIRLVSYHFHHYNKKARVFHGNTRMPIELELALMYGINRQRKKRFKDLSYRKSLTEWKELLNIIYPADDLNITLPSHSNYSLVTPLPKDGFVPLANKSPKVDLGVKTRIKKIHAIFTAKPCAKNYGLVSSPLVDTQIVSINNLKISRNPNPFPMQILACT